MGRGAHAAHAAYNGSGTQGISVTNKINDEDEIKSVFYNENDTTKQILHGCNLSEMKCIGKSDGGGRYKIFTPDDNADMIGDIYFNVEMNTEMSNINFVDTVTDVELPLDSFTDETRKLELKLVGSTSKFLDIDLNAREISTVKNENETIEGFEVINQTKFIEIDTVIYQFMVGKGDLTSTQPCNIAWRKIYGDDVSWKSILFSKLIEVNCVIAEPYAQRSATGGIVIFGGVAPEAVTAVATITGGEVAAITVTQHSAYAYTAPPTVTISPPESAGGTVATAVTSITGGGEVTVVRAHYGSGYTSVPTVTISPPPGYNPLFYLKMNTISNSDNINSTHFDTFIDFPLNDNNNPYYKTVYTLNYYGERPKDDNDFGKIIVSGSRNGLDEAGYFRETTVPRESVIINSFPNLFSYTLLPFIHFGRVSIGLDPIVSSTFSDNKNNHVLTIGAKFETLLGIDSNKKLIRSYDNGKNWERAPFYDGAASYAPNSPHFYTPDNTGNTQPGGADVATEELGDFIYFIPELDFVLTCGDGQWIAVGKQGIQADLTPGRTDEWRQFVFISYNDGFNWRPRVIKTYKASTREADDSDTSQFFNERVEYIAAYVFNPVSEGKVRVIMKGTKIFGEVLSCPIIVPVGISSALKGGNEPQGRDTHPIKAFAFLKGSNSYDFPEFDFTNADEIGLVVGRGSAYKLTNLEYIGALTDVKKPIFYGFQSSSSKGIVTVTKPHAPLSGRPTETFTTFFDSIYPINIKYANKGLLMGVFSNNSQKRTDSDVNSREYKFKTSIDGITWRDVTVGTKTDINSTKDPLLEGDDVGNFIIGIKNNSNFNLYKYNETTLNFEIILDYSKNITDIYNLNFVSNEWQIPLSIGNSECMLKSYNRVKWYKYNISVGDIRVRKIYSKPRELNYDLLYKIDDHTAADALVTRPAHETSATDLAFDSGLYASAVAAAELAGVSFSLLRSPPPSVETSQWRDDGPIRSSNVIGYSILVNKDDGAGVMGYKIGNIVFYQPPIAYERVNGATVWDATFKNQMPNDIVSIGGKIFMGCNADSSEFPGASTFDLPLVESVDNYTFIESESVYLSSQYSETNAPVTEFATNLTRLYPSPYDSNRVFAVGKFKSASSTEYGVILYREKPAKKFYTPYTQEDVYYWRVLMGSPTSIHPSLSLSEDDAWILSGFKDINDVVISKTTSNMVVVGKQRAFGDYNLVVFPRHYNFDDNDYKTQMLDFEEIYTVCEFENLWIVGGKPANSNSNKCVAYTYDLVNWKYIDFTGGAVTDNVTFKEDYPFFTTRTSVSDDISRKTDANNFEANDIKPVELSGQTAILLQISFKYNIPVHPAALPLALVGEKIYFIYKNGNNLTIEQNDSYPEPKIAYSLNRKQLVPSFTTIIDNIERRIVSSEYPSEFNMFYVILENNKFKLTSYISNIVPPSVAESGNKTEQKFRKFINIDENYLFKRTNGHCYKIEKVKNDNFITGVNSARYVSIGKGKFSSIFWSDDLLTWNDSNVNGIFDVVFDVTHKHGMWIAIGDGRYEVALSKDGKNWTGVYPQYPDNFPEITSLGLSFNSLDYHDPSSNNIADVLPYIPNIEGIFLKNLSILRLFDKIEYYVGTQIWQTLTFDDLKALIDTEIGRCEYLNLLRNTNKIKKSGNADFSVMIPGFTKSLNSKLETFTNISESGSFPNGLLDNQKLYIKMYYKKLEEEIGTTVSSSQMSLPGVTFDNLMNNTLIPVLRDNSYYVDSLLGDNYGFQLGDTYKNVNGYFSANFSTDIIRLRMYCKNFELSEPDINKFKLTRELSQITKLTQNLYFETQNKSEIKMNLDNFSLYSSHLILSGWFSTGTYITSMFLELNGYKINNNTSIKLLEYASIYSLGLNYNRYYFNDIDKEDGIGSIVIPLASTAYSGSSIPLDRYDSIKLRVFFNQSAGTNSYLNVTCVGQGTITYNNSTANLNIY